MLTPFALDAANALRDLKFEWRVDSDDSLFIPDLATRIEPRSFSKMEIFVNNTEYKPSFLERVVIWNGIQKAFRNCNWIRKQNKYHRAYNPWD